MFKVTGYQKLNDTEYEVWVDAPRIAAKAKPGQFVITQLDETAERIPLTISDSNPETGKIRLIWQVVGESTYKMIDVNKTGEFLDVVGPLGKPTEIQKYGTVLLVGGGVGIAPLFPIIRGLKQAGNKVITVLGAKTKDYLILTDECEKYSDELILMTDDGSFGRKGLVTEPMNEVFAREKVDQAWAIGPGIMMKFCTQAAEKNNTPIYVSLNPIMIDGTGMCGCCRIAIDGEIKFACVDGPEFLGSQVDWDSFEKRMHQFTDQESKAYQAIKA